MREKASNPFRRLLLPLLGVLGVVTMSACGSSSSSDTGPTPLPPAQADGAFFGVHDASLTSLVPGTGVGSVRVWDAGAQWNQIETAPGQYDWTTLDRIVSAAQQDHAQVTMVLAMTPAFYNADPTKPPKHLSDYRNFVAAVMKRYKDFHGSRGISSYQVWNEADVTAFWTGTQQQMAELTKIVHDVRDQVDPGAQVVSPPMAVRLPEQQDWLARFWATKVDGTPVWKYVDKVALNLYPQATYGKRPGAPEDTVRLLDQVRTRLQDDGVPDSIPIWNTEVNYGLKTGEPSVRHATPIPEQQQAAYVVRTYLLNAAYGVERVYWYRWDWGLLPKAQGGGTLGNTLLTDPTDVTKRTEAGKALAVVARWLTADDAKAPTCSHDSQDTYTCTIDHSGGTRYVYWNPVRTASVKVPDGANTKAGVSGTTSQVTAGSTLQVTGVPVMVDSSH